MASANIISEKKVDVNPNIEKLQLPQPNLQRIIFSHMYAAAET